VAILADVAPFARDSGLMRCRRTIWRGRKPVPAVLDTATVSTVPTFHRGIGRCPMVGTRHDSTIRNLYERLRAGGKVTKLATAARMHSLLVSSSTAWPPTKHRGGPHRRPDSSRHSLAALPEVGYSIIEVMLETNEPW
jgi:transposase